MPRPQDAAATGVIDPLCGMRIASEDAVGHVDHGGQTSYFCSASCLEQFRASPDTLIGRALMPASGSVPVVAHSAMTTEWTALQTIDAPAVVAQLFFLLPPDLGASTSRSPQVDPSPPGTFALIAQLRVESDFSPR